MLVIGLKPPAMCRHSPGEEDTGAMKREQLGIVDNHGGSDERECHWEDNIDQDNP